MLRKNIVVIMVLYFLLVFLVTVFAVSDCPTKGEYSVRVKGAVRDYLTYPSREKLMNLQDMLKVYATHDFTKCLAEETGRGSFTQICNDGTPYDRCSANKPLYCDNGNLINKCDICKCLKNQACKTDKTCTEKAETKQTPLIIEADKILAQKTLETANNTPAKNPKKYEEYVKREIEKATSWLNQANTEADKENYIKAIDDYKKSWQHSQKTIDMTNKEKPKKK